MTRKVCIPAEHRFRVWAGIGGALTALVLAAALLLSPAAFAQGNPATPAPDAATMPSGPISASPTAAPATPMTPASPATTSAPPPAAPAT
ncbi:MAG: hypothetical protein WA280_10600, partial [Xanthobacteraceae bacterium]